MVHARLLRSLPRLVRDLGGDPAALMAAAGIAGIRAGATYRQSARLLHLAASELDCPDFGMRLARRQGGGVFGPLGRAMRHSRTFGEALEYARTHSYAHSLAARITHARSPGGGVLVSHDILVDHMPDRAQAMEQILLLGNLMAMELTGGGARAQRVHFRHQAVSGLRVYRDYFGCEVRFGQGEDGVIYSRQALASPIVDPDAEIYRAATAFIEARFTRHRPPVNAQVRSAIVEAIGADRCCSEAVAVRLGLHPRTMHRRLAAEGTAFQQIKDEVRRDLIFYYVTQTDLPFTAISERLGFAEQSVMTRSCNRWFRASPTTLRLSINVRAKKK